MAGKRAVRELIEIEFDEPALMQTSVIAHPEQALVELGSCRCRALLEHQAQRSADQHTHQPLRPPTQGFHRANTRTHCHRGARGRYELEDHRSVRPRPLPARCDTEPPTTSAPLTVNRRLYRRSLKLALDWAVHRYLWRGQAVYIRSLFDANKNVTEPRRQRVRYARGIDARWHG